MIKLTNQEIQKLREYPVYKLLGLSRRKQHIRCPFHHEKTPSCLIDTEGGFKCFGCGVYGKNSIDFLMADGMSFIDACLEISKFICTTSTDH